MAGHRCSKLVALERHSWVIEQLAAGRPRPQIVRDLREREGISQPQALKYLQRADAERCEVYATADRAGLLSQCLAAAEKALELAQARGNPNEIVGAVRLLDQLLALGASHERRNRPWER